MTHVGFIGAAKRWMHDLRLQRMLPPQRLTCAELEEVLGEKVRTCQPWMANWRNRVYRVELARGLPLVAKQICVPTEAKVLQQYEQLGLLARLRIPGLHMPRPVALLPWQRTYVMELARGTPLDAMLWYRPGVGELCQACTLTGKLLAHVHAAWTRVVAPVPVDALARDLAEMPGGFSSWEGQIVEQALAGLVSEPVAVGQLYLDFKPSNVLYQDGTLCLIDPPEEHREGVVLWDFALFRSYLRRELWKSLATPWGRRRWLLQEALAAFERGYLESWGRLAPAAAVSRLLVHVLELQRLGQLLALQRGKIDLARCPESPLPWRRDPLGLAYTAASLLLLAAQKRGLIVEMARLLRRCQDTGGIAARGTIYLEHRDPRRMKSVTQ